MSRDMEHYYDWLDRMNLDDCQDSYDQWESAASDWEPRHDTREEAAGLR